MKSAFLQKSWAESDSVPAKEVRGVIGIVADHQTGNLAVELSRYFPESEIIDAASPEISGDAARFGGLIDVTGCGTEINHDDGWIHRLQSLIDNRNRGRKLQSLCVTKGLEPFANETINLSGAKKAGLYRMLQSEYKDIRSRHMDAERTAEDPELANQIADEFFRDSEDIEVCYRNGVRYHARLKETNSLAEKRIFISERPCALDHRRDPGTRIFICPAFCRTLRSHETRAYRKRNNAAESGMG